MKRIRELREALNIDQKVLAIELEVSQPTISDWESGRKKPAGKSLDKIAEYFDVSIDYLLERTDNPYLARENGQQKIRTNSPVQTLCMQYDIGSDIISWIVAKPLGEVQQWFPIGNVPEEDAEKMRDFFEINPKEFKLGVIPLFRNKEIEKKINTEYADRTLLFAAYHRKDLSVEDIASVRAFIELQRIEREKGK